VLTVNKVFADAAVKALYSCPPLKSNRKMERLLVTLNQPPGTTMFDYRRLIFSLDFGPEYLPREGPVIALIELLPRLSHLTFSIGQDEAPYGELASRIRKPYPKIWCALAKRFGKKNDVNGIKLRSWKWSWTMAQAGGVNHRLSLDEIIQLNTYNGPMTDLEDLHLVGFCGTDEVTMDADDFTPVTLSKCGEIVSSLQYLTTLKLEACSAVTGEFMTLLPQTLERLHITYCWNLTSDGLEEFLRVSGPKLKSLEICHNQGIHLGFLTALESSCPVLEELHVNMHLFRSVLDARKDLDFTSALVRGQKPTWPTSLQRIELLHVRPFTYAAAHELLHSLMAKSQDLDMLRYLVIKAKVDTDWRERASMRAYWLSLLEKVFLRPRSPDPKPHGPLGRRNQVVEATMSSPTTPVRRSARTSSTANPGFMGQTSTSSVVASDNGVNYVLNPGHDANNPLASAARYHVQGKCNRVELSLTDGEPALVQFGMEDFMDGSSSNSTDDDSDFSSTS
jgi:hypothetical protein